MHTFIPSTIDTTACAKCKRPAIDHTIQATCEACSNVGLMLLYPDVNGMLLCQVCVDKEEAIRMSKEEQDKRVKAMSLQAARSIDYSIEVKDQLFNATIVSMNELKAIIDADESIENKQYALAEAATERLNHFKKVIFDLDEKKVEASNQQRAVQSYLNQLANTLRTEEREALKLKDINYRPAEGKVVKPKVVKPGKKYDRDELVKAAALTGIPLSSLQAICVSRNMTPQEFADKFVAANKAVDEAK